MVDRNGQEDDPKGRRSRRQNAENEQDPEGADVNGVQTTQSAVRPTGRENTYKEDPFRALLGSVYSLKTEQRCQASLLCPPEVETYDKGCGAETK